MIKMIAFDLDGTICDSVPMCVEAFCKAVSPYTEQKITKKEVLLTFGLNEVGMVKAIVKENWEKALEDFYHYYEELHEKCAKPFPGICEFIDFLKQHEILVALITGKGKRSCEITLKKLKLDDTFDEIMLGSEQQPSKTQSILLLMEQYSVKPNEFYYIGDMTADVTACHDAGVTCLSASWQEFSYYDELQKINVPYVFESICKLKDYIYLTMNS